MNNTFPEKNQTSSQGQVSAQTNHYFAVHPSKSASQNYIRTTVYLPKNLHRQLKVVAALKERDMSGIIEDLLNEWLHLESHLLEQ